MRNISHACLFFLLYSHPSKTKMAHPTFIKRSSDEYKTYAYIRRTILSKGNNMK